MLDTVLEIIHDAVQDYQKPERLDQRKLSSGFFEKRISNIRTAQYFTEKKLADTTLTESLKRSIIRTIDILAEMTYPEQPYIFSGSSTEISSLLLRSACKDRPAYNSVEDSIRAAVLLNSEQNLRLRESSFTLSVPINAIIVDEYASSLTKVNDLMKNMLHRRKVVVFAVENIDHMNEIARSYFQMYTRLGRLKYGTQDSSLVNLLKELAMSTTLLRGMQGGGLIEKSNIQIKRNYYWNTTLYTSEQRKLLENAEVRQQRIFQNLEKIAESI